MQLMIIVPCLLFVFLFYPPISQTDGGMPGQGTVSMKSDMEVISALSSRNHQEAAEAEKEIVKRGERMIPLLLLHKGDKRHYNGGGLGVRETAGWAFWVPKEGEVPKESDPPVLTVELASLYLISGIYYGHFDFAQSPVLSYRSKPSGKARVINNNGKMVKRAYNTYEKWVRKMEAEGLTALRSRKEPPLAHTPFFWW